MIKILETITDIDYKKDILEHITQTTDILKNIENSIKKDSYNISLDDTSLRIHNIYSDSLKLYLQLNIK